MPGKHTAGAADEPCRRCQRLSVLVVRAEPLCHECFAKYVHTKIIKRLEGFRVNFAASPDQQRRILIPLSFGTSSTTLLHVLNLHLATQKLKTGRTGFAISIIFVESEEDAANGERLNKIREQYPDHEYASLPLHDVFRLIPNDASLGALVPSQADQRSLTPSEKLVCLINSLPTATARADVLSTLRTRLIVEHAKQAGCESVVWGDSTTRLAEKTLAETAKGRGFSLPWHVSDGESPFGLKFHYPNRDLLKKELVSYIDLAVPGLSALVYEPVSGTTQASTSSKNTTIDDFMKQYFESVEENFPSIVSNVVRTTSKFEVPAGASANPRCSLCSMPVPGGHFGIHGWGGDQQDASGSSNVAIGSGLCYGCTRSMPKSFASTRGE